MFDIYFDVQINAPVAQVFKAISSAKDLINWWPLRCSGEPRLNAEYNFFFTPEYDWLAEVVTVKDNEQLHFKMTRADEDWDPTTFGFDLAQHGTGTRLSFFHINWPERNHHYRRSAHCWALLLQGLKEYVESGKIIPFEERA